jgi:membrane-associated phospholipid phosphatase
LIAIVVFVTSSGVAGGQTTVPASDGDQSQPAPPAASSGTDFFLVKKLFTTLARDLMRLPSPANAPVLISGGMLAVAVYPLDHEATLAASSSPVLKTAFSGWGKALGREWVQGGTALAAYVAGTIWDKPRVVDVAGDLIEAQLVAVTATQAMKFAFSRERPDREARSFPSGHASSAFATARVLQRHLGRKVAIPAYAIAVYTSASRLQANSHYASDIVFGAALGIAVAQTATIELGDTRVQITPVVTPHGAQLSVSWK